jgi:oligopeptide transport system ATP-binding protein
MNKASLANTSQPILEAKEVGKVFERKGSGNLVALEEVSLSLNPSECVGLVGESGCGKSTLAQILTRFVKPSSGEVLFKGRNIAQMNAKELREMYRSVQMVFQQPGESFDPRQTLGSALYEGMRNAGVSKVSAEKRAHELLEQCGLPSEVFGRYPREVSGGQCQRASIARALAIEPEVLICDEVTSALDVTVQQQIVELLKRLRKELDMTMLFICHDLALVKGMCDRVVVMKQGRIVEEGPTEQVLHNPQTEYVKALLSAML